MPLVQNIYPPSLNIVLKTNLSRNVENSYVDALTFAFCSSCPYKLFGEWGLKSEILSQV